MTEFMERVVREEREWAEARLHYRIHGTYDSRDECSVCQGIVYPDSPYLKLTPLARDRLGVSDYEQIAIRAESLNARVGAIFSSRHGWIATAETLEKRLELRGRGPLVAVLTGLLDDLEGV